MGANLGEIGKICEALVELNCFGGSGLHGCFFFRSLGVVLVSFGDVVRSHEAQPYGTPEFAATAWFGVFEPEEIWWCTLNLFFDELLTSWVSCLGLKVIKKSNLWKGWCSYKCACGCRSDRSTGSDRSKRSKRNVRSGTLNGGVHEAEHHN